MVDIGQIKQDVLDGNIAPLEGYALLKDIEKSVKNAIAAIEEYALAEAENYGAKSFEDYGYNYELRTGGKRYSYKHIPEWDSVNRHLKNLEEKYKMAAKAYDNGTIAIDEETGEKIPVPHVTNSKSSIIIKRYESRHSKDHKG